MNQPPPSGSRTHASERPDLLASDPWRAESGVVETTLLLPTPLFRALEAAAGRQQMSAGRLVRELIRLHLTPPAEHTQGGHVAVAGRRTVPGAEPMASSAHTPTPDVRTSAGLPDGAVEPPRGVLVVDDSTAIRELLAGVFRSDGFAVWQAGDGREAEAVFRTHQPRVGLILMDVRMPGVSGPQALTAIRQFAPLVPCWFMSGSLGEHTEAGLLSLGAERVLSKPFRLDELRTLVSAVFDSRRATAGVREAPDGAARSHPAATSPEEV